MSKSDKLEIFLSKKKNIFLLYGIVSICILLLAFTSCTPKEKTQPVSPSRPENPPLEETLEDILSGMQGVGHVRVAVTYETGVESVPATDKNGENETIVTLGTGNSARVASQKEIMPTVRGVIVIAEGGGDSAVRADILYAVQALTGAPAHSIGVFPAK